MLFLKELTSNPYTTYDPILTTNTCYALHSVASAMVNGQTPPGNAFTFDGNTDYFTIANTSKT